MRKPMELITYPYSLNGREYFPIIPFFISSHGTRFKFHGLIDSGANISVFKHEIAEQLGIDIKKGKEISLGGVGGSIKGYIHTVNVEIAGKTFTCPIVFSYEYAVSFNLLGRETFFRAFRITFEERKKRVTLE